MRHKACLCVSLMFLRSSGFPYRRYYTFEVFFSILFGISTMAISCENSCQYLETFFYERNFILSM